MSLSPLHCVQMSSNNSMLSNLAIGTRPFAARRPRQASDNSPGNNRGVARFVPRKNHEGSCRASGRGGAKETARRASSRRGVLPHNPATTRSYHAPQGQKWATHHTMLKA